MTPIAPILPEGVNLEELLANLRKLSWGAADILMAYARDETPPYGFSRELKVQESIDGPVSAADLAVNAWLLDGLEAHFPSAPWKLLSEETAKGQLIERETCDSEWLWILDPLDGTKDFLAGNGEYAVHLALVRGHRPVLGVVLIPELEELWLGVLGLDAWCEDRLGNRKTFCFSKRSYLNDLILVASRNHRDERLEHLISQLSICEAKAVGSVGCKVATILRGETDLYISLSGKTAPKDWDLAAPEILLCSAGGAFTHADGRELTYNTGDLLQKGCLIASHGLNHSLICQMTLKEIGLIDPSFIV
ncbi:3'(2'),5'-bisphosphate nucleotidase CysQ [Prochlorococcus sp. MIT 1307]|uniref:3'(2'),5'-bisphosphate nucleotidase CysQ family protein n=1 Tax=Prochlorococcus sp. MIT 1307 TaxID=3096219 RepID=UPI002A75D280|nr:3'(2'),5'-bisphosphate nucleotidase CysQ [Prochlorococcus sp. MIT 1307]